MIKNVTSAVIRERLKKYESDFYLDSEYVKSSIPITLKCSKCSTPRSFKTKNGLSKLPKSCPCIKIGGTYRIPSRLESLNYKLKQNAPKSSMEIISLSDLDVDKGTVQCSRCLSVRQDVYIQQYTSGKAQCNCPALPDISPLEMESFISQLSDCGSTFKYVKGYTTFEENALFECVKCNVRSIYTPEQVINEGYQCACMDESMKETSDAQIAYMAKFTELTGFQVEQSAYKLPHINQAVSGYIPELDLVIEYLKSRYHGNPRLYAKHEKCHPSNRKITAGELYQAQMDKIDKLQRLGYSVLVIWEDAEHFELAKALLPKLDYQFTYLDSDRKPNLDLIAEHTAPSECSIAKGDKLEVYWRYFDSPNSDEKYSLTITEIYKDRIALFKDSEKYDYIAPLESLVNILNHGDSNG